MHGEHEGHEDPSKANKKGILSEAPENLNDDGVAVVDAVGCIDVAGNIAIVYIDCS